MDDPSSNSIQYRVLQYSKSFLSYFNKRKTRINSHKNINFRIKLIKNLIIFFMFLFPKVFRIILKIKIMSHLQKKNIVKIQYNTLFDILN